MRVHVRGVRVRAAALRVPPFTSPTQCPHPDARSHHHSGARNRLPLSSQAYVIFVRHPTAPPHLRGRPGSRSRRQRAAWPLEKRESGRSCGSMAIGPSMCDGCRIRRWARDIRSGGRYDDYRVFATALTHATDPLQPLLICEALQAGLANACACLMGVLCPCWYCVYTVGTNHGTVILLCVGILGRKK